MNPLAEKIYKFYKNDAGAYDTEIAKWGLNSASYVGDQFGYIIGDAYTDLNDKFGSADREGVLEFGTELFTNLDEETKQELGEAIIADYKKRKNIA